MRYMVDGDSYALLAIKGWVGAAVLVVGALSAIVFGVRLAVDTSVLSIGACGLGLAAAVLGFGLMLTGRRVRHEYMIETVE